jgi:hypothetical protein
MLTSLSSTTFHPPICRRGDNHEATEKQEGGERIPIKSSTLDSRVEVAQARASTAEPVSGREGRSIDSSGRRGGRRKSNWIFFSAKMGLNLEFLVAKLRNCGGSNEAEEAPRRE